MEIGSGHEDRNVETFSTLNLGQTAEIATSTSLNQAREIGPSTSGHEDQNVETFSTPNSDIWPPDVYVELTPEDLQVAQILCEFSAGSEQMEPLDLSQKSTKEMGDLFRFDVKQMQEVLINQDCFLGAVENETETPKHHDDDKPKSRETGDLQIITESDSEEDWENMDSENEGHAKNMDNKKAEAGTSKMAKSLIYLPELPVMPSRKGKRIKVAKRKPRKTNRKPGRKIKQPDTKDESSFDSDDSVEEQMQETKSKVRYN